MTSSSQQPRAVIYTRVSSDEQTKGYGLEYQLEDCRRSVAQHGHQLICVYSDPGISGTVEDRPGLNELRRDAQERKFDVVYFWKSDRLARDEILQLTLYREFRRLGIDTCSVAEPEMNDLMRGIYAVFGAEDLRNIKAKTFSGRLRAMRAGKWIGAPPYGYLKDEGFKLVANPQEAPSVVKLFEWFVYDRLSLYALTRRANEQRLPTWCDNRGRRKRVNGAGFWSVGTVGQLLRREYYATGEAVFTVRPALGQVSNRYTDSAAKEEITVHIPPLIPLSLFQRAHEQLRHNSEYSPRAAKHSYLFAKKLRCANCGLKLIATMSNRLMRYYRGSYLNRQQRCGRCGCYPESALDSAVWPRLVSFFSNPQVFLAKLEAYTKKDSQLPDIRAQEAALKQVEEQVREQEKVLLACQVEGFYTTEILLEKKRELKALRQDVSDRCGELQRMALMESQRSTAIASAASLYEALRDKLKSPTYAEKAEVYQILVEKIILNGNEAEVWLNVPLLSETTHGLSSHPREVLLTSTPFMQSVVVNTPPSQHEPIAFGTYGSAGLLTLRVPLPRGATRRDRGA